MPISMTASISRSGIIRAPITMRGMSVVNAAIMRAGPTRSSTCSGARVMRSYMRVRRLDATSIAMRVSMICEAVRATRVNRHTKANTTAKGAWAISTPNRRGKGPATSSKRLSPSLITLNTSGMSSE
jgi:hypothetical protein